MKRAIQDLARFSDERLFREISEGAEHLVENISRLDAAARTLSETDDRLTAAILGAFAAEESAKVLILLDVVRCPKNRSKEKTRTLSYFYNHVGKYIYAEACRWQPARFQDTIDYVESDREPYYLDGPCGSDWIFRNDIEQLREQRLYVDFVREIAEDSEPFWVAPSERFPLYEHSLFRYTTPPSVNLVATLHRAKVTKVPGLRVVAEIWRPFEPTPETSVDELISMNRRTLETFQNRGILDENRPQTEGYTYLDEWPFPLWSLEVGKNKDSSILKELRSKRKRFYPE